MSKDFRGVHKLSVYRRIHTETIRQQNTFNS